MDIKYNLKFDKTAIEKCISRITNQIFKLLPNREEGGDWQKPLENLIVEVGGMAEMLPAAQPILFSIVCRMEGLMKLKSEEDFLLFRKTIFECLSALAKVKECLD